MAAQLHACPFLVIGADGALEPCGRMTPLLDCNLHRPHCAKVLPGGKRCGSRVLRRPDYPERTMCATHDVEGAFRRQQRMQEAKMAAQRVQEDMRREACISAARADMLQQLDVALADPRAVGLTPLQAKKAAIAIRTALGIPLTPPGEATA